MCMYSSHYISKWLSSHWTGTTPAPGTNKITTRVYCLFLLQNIFVCGSHLAFYIFERKTLRTCGLWRSFPSFVLLELCSLFLQFSTRFSLLLFYLAFCLYVLHLRFPTMDTLYGLIVWQYNNALVSFFFYDRQKFAFWYQCGPWKSVKRWQYVSVVVDNRSRYQRDSLPR